MAYSANDIREMIDGGNHSEIIAAIKKWNEYRVERFSMAAFDLIEIRGGNVLADGRALDDNELRLWLDWCQGITYKDR